MIICIYSRAYFKFLNYLGLNYLAILVITITITSGRRSSVVVVLEYILLL